MQYTTFYIILHINTLQKFYFTFIYVFISFIFAVLFVKILYIVYNDPMGGNGMNSTFIKTRINNLVLQSEISGRELSQRLGYSSNYIHEITSYSTSTLPSMRAFFDICEYFEITPEEFFHLEFPLENPKLRKLMKMLKNCPDDDIQVLIDIVSKFSSLTPPDAEGETIVSEKKQNRQKHSGKK